MRIDTYQKLIEVLTLQVANLPTYQAAIGATNQELQDVTDALDLLIYLRDYADLMDANKQTVFQIKQAVFNGDKEEPIAAFPVFPPAAPPHTPTADLLGDAQARHRRWKSAAGYTEEIGIALGIEENSQPIAPESVKPNIQVSSMFIRFPCPIAATQECGTFTKCEKAQASSAKLPLAKANPPK